MTRGIHTSEFWLAMLGVGAITALGALGALSAGAALGIAGISVIFTLARAALKARAPAS